MTRIILIDDHNLFREGMKALFQSNPDISVVAEAATAELGVQAVERTPADLVVADFSLPDYEAPWLLGRVRQKRPDLPVLMLSQFTELERVRQVMALGANGYVVKTASRDELMQAVSIVAAGGIYVHPAVAKALLTRPEAGPEEFTPREKGILQLLIHGLSNQEIAERLHVSVGTVKGDLRGLFAKLAVADRTQLLAAAIAKGLIAPSA